MFRIAIAMLTLSPFITTTTDGLAADFHVAPTGQPTGDGSRAKPWDLATALSHPKIVKPGDTIWLHGGTYKGSFRSELKGNSNTRIFVRQAAGERAIIDIQPDKRLGAGLYCHGAWTRFQGFEVTCSNTKRRTKQAGSWPTDIRRGSIECRGSHLQFVNLVVHDLGQGFGFWSQAAGGEIHGCLIYNNGHGRPDRGHGHGIYAQNKESIKRITDNIIFQQFGYGIHVYGSSRAFLKGFRIAGNVMFHNGCLQKPGGQSAAMLVGGGAPLDDIVVRENLIYNGGMQIGYSSSAANRSVTIRKNYVVGLSLNYQRKLVMEENTIVGGWPVLRVIQNANSSLTGFRVARNKYYNTKPKHYPFFLMQGKKRSGLFLDGWRKLGFDKAGSLSNGHPKKTRVFVRKNSYAAGRANVVVFNWSGSPHVDVDLKDVLKTGQRYRIVNARNYRGPAVASGTYTGKPVRLPQKANAPIKPVGMSSYKLPACEPQFGAYVVLAD